VLREKRRPGTKKERQRIGRCRHLGLVDDGRTTLKEGTGNKGKGTSPYFPRGFSFYFDRLFCLTVLGGSAKKREGEVIHDRLKKPERDGGEKNGGLVFKTKKDEIL